MLVWSQCGFHKKRAGTRYAEHVFLYPMSSVAHVVHCGASGARNIDALFFIHGWDQDAFDKMRARKRYAELVFLNLVGSMGQVVCSVASGTRNINILFSFKGGTKSDLTQSAPHRLRRTCVFTSGAIYGSGSAFRCIWGA
jgi:hypothetical protein